MKKPQLSNRRKKPLVGIGRARIDGTAAPSPATPLRAFVAGLRQKF
ncbi:hypothetical protein PQR68_17670 [Paraburkholderia agricolaris]|uniref:Uncharacterized protein n=1 Tax=Paraburkholderia agricolaris TaxID=2152888 RepID=A0ABW8ZLT7_9BURK|nr:hypothetical protein [Paraburkholderia agricolaris]